mmetsp:Transcript_41494/g.129037  ORF Transcript_41494/g.129037 Transcript_41494/m.129037 type:complete len:469 (+) Transcript_41494:79-1485(+)
MARATRQLRIIIYLGAAACGVLILINFAEQPFARSLVTCDVPLNTSSGAVFSGSAWCGDRLYVIDSGQRLCGMGQVLEQLSRLCMIVLVSSVADVWGRKAALLIGLSSVAGSTVLFLAACLFRPLSKPLYALAQGLQGAHGMESLLGIVHNDLSHEMSGPESLRLFAWRDKVMALTFFFFGAGGLSLQAVDMTDFTVFWAKQVAVAAILAAAALLWMPETLPEEKRRGQHGSVLRLVLDELNAYLALVRERRILAHIGVYAALHGARGAVFTTFFPWLMAFFGYTQAMAILALWPMIILKFPAINLYTWLARRCGHRRVFEATTALQIVQTFAFLPFIAGSGTGPPNMAFLKLYLGLLFEGRNSAFSSVTSRIVGPEDAAKFNGFAGMAMLVCGMASTYIYAMAFDARATTYLGRLGVVIVEAVFCAIQAVVYYCSIRGDVVRELDVIQAEEDAQQLEAKAGATKKDD